MHACMNMHDVCVFTNVCVLTNVFLIWMHNQINRVCVCLCKVQNCEIFVIHNIIYNISKHIKIM